MTVIATSWATWDCPHLAHASYPWSFNALDCSLFNCNHCVAVHAFANVSNGWDYIGTLGLPTTMWGYLRSQEVLNYTHFIAI